MKLCPECRRNYFDDSLLYCLDDGSSLLEGPASESASSSSGGFDEPQTAILHEAATSGEAETRPQIHTTAQTSELQPPNRSFDKRILVGAIVLALVVVGGFFGYRYLKADTQLIESIAVMPFVNEGADPEIEYLADGMTESLIASLSQVPNLNVKARSTVFRFKGKDADIRTIGEQLNVQAILSGRLVPRGNEVALYLELIDASSENVIFKADYMQPMANLVALQKDVAHDVANRLRAKLTAAERQQVEKSHTENAEAYRLYLQGRFHWNKREPEEHRKAIRLFEQAIALDPGYALAYAGLADCYAVDSSPAKGDERIRLLREAAGKALALDPTLGQAHAALANGHWENYDWASAERELRTAIELDPDYPTARQWYAELLSRLGRHDEAIAEMRKARELDPLSLIIASDMIYVLANARRYDEAIEQADKTLAMDADWRQAHFLKSVVYELKGELDKALTVKEQFVRNAGELSPERRDDLLNEIAELKKALQEGGPMGYWRRELKFELDDRDRPGEFSPFYIAEIYSYLNEKDEAFKWLNRAIDEKDDFIDLAKVSPSLDNLRSDPRWPSVLARLNFTP